MYVFAKSHFALLSVRNPAVNRVVFKVGTSKESASDFMSGPANSSTKYVSFDIVVFFDSVCDSYSIS